MKLNKTIVAVTTALALAGGTTAAAVATNSTAPPADSSNAVATEQTTSDNSPAASNTNPTTNSDKNERTEKKRTEKKPAERKRSADDRTHERRERKKGHHKKGWKKRGGAKLVMETLGVTKDELKAARKADKSLEQLAADKGISKTELVTKLTAKTKERLTQAVADGKLTQEQADKKLAHMTAKIEQRVSQKPSERQHHKKRSGHTKGHHKKGWKKRGGAKFVMEALGVTKDELKAARKADKSLEQLAADKGISKTELVTKLTAKTKERLTQAVADGKLTQEQADKKLAHMTAKIEQRVSQKPSELMGRSKRKNHERGKQGRQLGPNGTSPTSQA